jgi:hypothetical protein
MGYDLSEDRLLLHTIQTAEAFEELASKGVLVPDAALAEPLHADAYDWLFRQMAERLPTTGKAAIWLWARIRRQELVNLCRLGTGEVLLTCRVPRERVLLSHFADWHAALNRHPLVIELPDEDDEAYSARIDRIFDEVEDRIRAAGVARNAGYRHWPADVREELEQSWEYILDPANYGHHECWQATVHSLHAHDVVEAVRIER